MAKLVVTQNCSSIATNTGVKIPPHPNLAFMDSQPKETTNQNFCVGLELVRLPDDATWDDFTLKIIFLQLAHALHHVHEKKYCHGEISSDKVFLSKDRVVLIRSKNTLQKITPTNRAKDILDMWRVFDEILLHSDAKKDSKDLLQIMKLDCKRTAEILRHPYFWDAGKKLQFLSAVAQFSKGEKGKSLKDALDEKSKEVFEGDWKSRLRLREELDQCNDNFRDRKQEKLFSSCHSSSSCKERLEDSQMARRNNETIPSEAVYKHSQRKFGDGKPKYNGKKLQSLLNFMRNRLEHFWEDSIDTQACYGNSQTDGFYIFFSEKFQNLFQVVYKVVQQKIYKGIKIARISDEFFKVPEPNKLFPNSEEECMDVD